MSVFKTNFLRGHQAICKLSQKEKVPSILESTDRKKEKISEEIKLIDILGEKREQPPILII